MFAFLLFLFLLVACGPHAIPDNVDGVGGGQDSVTIDLPFAAGYQSRCVQGAGGSYSHTYTSTRYDVDLDTPNDSDDPVYAPVGGTAYVQDSSPGYGFGIHINIDLGDGTYIVLGHLSEVLVGDGEEVASGELIGVEGTTGNSTGDHVHIGRHKGSASQDATRGTSVEGLTLRLTDASRDASVEQSTSAMSCGVSSGHIYESELAVPFWHPDGALLKSYDGSNVYLVEEGELRHFVSEAVFWSYNYSFDNLVIVSAEELDCYQQGDPIGTSSSITAVRESGETWLVVGKSSSADYYAVRVGDVEPEAVLASWGVGVEDVEDLPEESGELEGATCRSGNLEFRDGTLLKEESTSDVYLVAGGVAMPIVDWNTYLLLGFAEREIVVVQDGAVERVQSSVGSCSVGLQCLEASDLQMCGGPDDVEDIGGWGEDDGDSGDSGSSSAGTDADGDGWSVEEGDCDDGWYGTYPGALEWCGDGADNDCDGAVDEDCGEYGEDEEEESASASDPPDDLNEGLSWIHVDEDVLGLTVGDVFDASVNGEDVAVTGYGFPIDWGYSTAYLADYDSATDIAWYALADGSYRLTMRTRTAWADLDGLCSSTVTHSDLCHLNGNGTYSLCVYVHYGEISPLASQDCSRLE